MITRGLWTWKPRGAGRWSDIEPRPSAVTRVADRPWDGGPDRQKDVGSPVDMLVDTVARMQLDLADLRAENRMLRTPGVPQVVCAPRQAAFTTTKVGTKVGTIQTGFRRYCAFEWMGQ